MNSQRFLAERIRRDSTELLFLMDGASGWHFPIGTSQYPPEMWYVASLHDESGGLNDGYGHTGWDLNLDLEPWGDVDRGQPVWSVAGGTIAWRSYSTSYLGSVGLLVDFEGINLWLRYWHLADDEVFWSLKSGDFVEGGIQLGSIGNYRLGAGGDHLHFDMALQVFGPHWWFTNHPEIEWINPRVVLKAKLNPEIVEMMVKKGS